MDNKLKVTLPSGEKREYDIILTFYNEKTKRIISYLLKESMMIIMN